MGTRRPLFLLLAVMLAVAVGVGGATLWALYDAGLDQQRERLVEVAQARARIIEAVARFDAEQSADYPGGAFQATLSQFKEAHERFEGFGRTGEFTLARLESDRIVYLLQQRFDGEGGDTVALSSADAEPMRRALLGQAGTLVGPDYRGVTVLAAHEPVAVDRLGIVAKIDLAEVRAPYVRAGLVAGGVSLALVLLGALAFRRVGGPLMEELEAGERRYRELAEQFRATLEHTTDLITVVDDSQTIVYQSPSVKRVLGYESEEWVGRDPREFIHPEDVARIDAAERRIVESPGESQTVVFRCRHKDGSWREMEGSGRSFVLPDGRVHQVVTTRDVTERLRREREAVRQATALRQTHNAIVITDRDGAIEYVNPAFERITGYTQEEALGRTPRILKSGEHDAAFYEEMWATILRGEVWSGRLINKRKDGALYTEEQTISPIRGPDGGIDGFVGIKRDVSQLVSLEQQLRQSQKLEAIGKLAGGVAHDFNNMLTAILANGELLLADLERGDPRRESVEEILDAGRRAAALTRQLLAFSRKQVLQPKRLSLNDVVANVEKMLGRLIGEDVELVTQLAPDLWAVEADPGQMDQVILNLAVNARDAMPEGGTLTIETRNVELDEDYAAERPMVTAGPYVVLSISDTGVGMDAATRERIFEPFFTTKEKGTGTGLGLAMVYGIVKQSGGFIWVYSEPGEGTTFRIYLPRIAGAAEREPRPEEREEPLTGSETVLLVEDDPTVLGVSRGILERNGYTVLAAAGPEEAMGVLEGAAEIDLLVTDLIMPGMSGIELAERVAEVRPDLPVLYLSGYSDHAVLKRGVLEPEMRFLQKPFTSVELLRAVRRAL